MYAFKELTDAVNTTRSSMDSILFKYKIALEKEVSTFKAKSANFAANNFSFLAVHRDLDDAPFICHRLSEEQLH